MEKNSDVKKVRMLTMPIINADLGLNAKVCVYL